MLAMVAVHVFFLNADSNRVAKGRPAGAGLALIRRSEQGVATAATGEDAGVDAVAPVLRVFSSTGRVHRTVERWGAYLREQSTLSCITLHSRLQRALRVSRSCGTATAGLRPCTQMLEDCIYGLLWDHWPW